MRELILKNRWQSKGAQFGSLGGAQCVKNFGDVKKELFAIRNSAALCDFSFVKKFEFDEGDGIDFLDSILAANILKLRYGKIVDTFLADESGKITAETFVANIDDKIILAAEQAGDASLNPISEKSQNVRDITDSHVLLSVDGPLAWKVAREIFGADILNLPFLSIEKYDFEGESVYLLRNGKTGEFGYQFLAPSSAAESLSAKIEASLETLGGCVCGFDAHKIARMEGNFFNIYGEGLKVECPLELGLQWMVDFDKESFVGSKGIFQKRENGLARRLGRPAIGRGNQRGLRYFRRRFADRKSSLGSPKPYARKIFGLGGFRPKLRAFRLRLFNSPKRGNDGIDDFPPADCRRKPQKRHGGIICQNG